MRITRKQLRKIIRESIIIIAESKAEKEEDREEDNDVEEELLTEPDIDVPGPLIQFVNSAATAASAKLK